MGLLPRAPLGDRVARQVARPEERWPHHDAARRGRRCDLSASVDACECCTSALPMLCTLLLVKMPPPLPLRAPKPLPAESALEGRPPWHRRSCCVPDVLRHVRQQVAKPSAEGRSQVVQEPAPCSGLALSVRFFCDFMRSRRRYSLSGGTLKRPPPQPWRDRTQRTFQELSANPRMRSDRTADHRESSLFMHWCKSAMASSNSS